MNQKVLNVQKTEHMTSLHTAAHAGDLIRVKSLVNKGADIDGQTSDRWTALHRAVHEQKEDVVRFLVESGADCNIPNNKGQTAVHLAAEHDNALMILLLVEGHGDLNARDVTSSFSERSPFIHRDVFLSLIEHLCILLLKMVTVMLLNSSAHQVDKSTRLTEFVLHS